MWLMSSLPAQTTSAVKGNFTDKENGQPLVAVKVTIVSVKSAASKYELLSDKSGDVLKKGIVPDIYQITIEKTSYIPAATSTRLSVGKVHDISIQLERIKDQPAAEINIIKEAVDLVTAGKYTQAMPILDKAIAQDNKNALLYFYRGVALEKTAQTDEALTSYMKAAELKSDFELALSSAAKLLARKNNPGQAAELYQKVMALGSKDTIAIHNYGICLINLQQNDAAKAIFEKVLTLDAENSDSLYELGLIELGAGNVDKAKELLEKVIQIDPSGSKAATAKEILSSL
jgi:tetratricopeptide (TPR) repeat protein